MREISRYKLSVANKCVIYVKCTVGENIINNYVILLYSDSN